MIYVLFPRHLPSSFFPRHGSGGEPLNCANHIIYYTTDTLRAQTARHATQRE